MADHIVRPIIRSIIRPIIRALTAPAGSGGSAYTPANTFLTVAGAWFYGWDNTDLKVNSDGTGGSVADGGTVGRWNDRSGYGNHINQTTANLRPVWKDNKVRCFWATNTTTRQAYLNNTATSTVFARQNCSGGMIVDLPGVGQSVLVDLGLSELGLFVGDTVATQYRFLRYHDGGALNSTTLNHTARKMVLTFRSNATNIIFNINGVDYTAASESAVNMSRLWIARFNGGSPKPMNYREIVYFASDVGAAGIANLRTYLNTQASSATINTAKTVVLYGDSMTMGVGSETGKPWHDYVTNRSDSLWYNFGLDGGYLFSPHVTAANVAALKGATEGVCVMWICTNDIIAGGRTAAQCETSLWAYTDTLRAAGMKVLVCTLQDFATNRAIKDDLNGRIVANWATHADGIVRLDTAPELDDAADTTYFTSDGVHLKDTGHAAVGALIQTAMAALS